MNELEIKQKLENIDRQLIKNRYTENRVRWFEATVVLTIFIAGIAFAKLFI